MGSFVLILAVTGGFAGSASAQEDGHRDGSSAADQAAAKARNRINLRIGTATSDNNGRPTICMEVRTVGRLFVEGCGTGSGLLHNQSGAELAHFRAKWLAHRHVVRGGQLRVLAGLGFAELQLDLDKPGFVFGTPTGDKIEAAGPEGSLSLQLLHPIRSDWELLFNLTGGMAWIPHADELAEPQSRAQPFASFEFGIGW